MRLRRGSLSQSREKNNLWHPGYLLLCYRLKFRVAYFTVKTDVTRKCWCVTNTRKKCSASKYRPSENTTTVFNIHKKTVPDFLLFRYFDWLSRCRVQVFVVPRKFNFDLRLKGDFIRDRKNDTRSFANFLLK